MDKTDNDDTLPRYAYNTDSSDGNYTIQVEDTWRQALRDKLYSALDTSLDTSTTFTLANPDDLTDDQSSTMPIPSGQIQADAPGMADLVRQSEGSGARLRLGRYLAHYHARGFSYDVLRQALKRDHGVDLPSDSRCSVYRGAYQAWMKSTVRSSILAASNPDDAHMQIGSPEARIALEDGSVVRLADFPIDKLYMLRHQLRDKPVEEVLAMARAHNEGQLRALLKGKNINQGDPDKPIGDVATLKLPRTIYDNLEAFVDRLRTVTGKHNISWGAALEFMLGQFHPDELDDAALDFLWRSAHGELTPEEGAELQREYYTV